jgi:hypothetical protein
MIQADPIRLDEESVLANSVECHTAAEMFLDTPERCGHVVQFHEADARLLVRNVSRYLLEGLKRGNGQLVVATPARLQAISRQFETMGADLAACVRQERITCLDAEETLAKFMSGGQPDWNRFDASVGAVVRDAAARSQFTGLRAYGEMVGLLWKAGRYSSAIRLERFWDQLLHAHSFSLFCAYPIDVFGSEFQMGALDAILKTHTHLLPAGKNEDLEKALDESMNEILGRRAEGLRSLINANLRPSWATVPRAEATILWLRSNLPDDAEEILVRARLRYRASQSLRSNIARDHLQ